MDSKENIKVIKKLQGSELDIRKMTIPALENFLKVEFLIHVLHLAAQVK